MTKEKLATYRGNADLIAQLNKLIDSCSSLEDAKKYRAEREALISVQHSVEDAVSKLPQCERRLIRYHFIQGMPFAEICIEMAYSRSQVYNIYKRALTLLQEL